MVGRDLHVDRVDRAHGAGSHFGLLMYARHISKKRLFYACASARSPVGAPCLRVGVTPSSPESTEGGYPSPVHVRRALRRGASLRDVRETDKGRTRGARAGTVPACGFGNVRRRVGVKNYARRENARRREVRLKSHARCQGKAKASQGRHCPGMLAGGLA